MTRLLFLSAVLWIIWGCSNESIEVESPTGDQAEELFDPADIEYDSIVDVRDSQVYKITKIDGKWWMAENLNYAADSSFCYNDEPDSCAIYGRLYPWTVAMDIDSMYNEYNATFDEQIKPTHQGLCPKGWHIPTEKEWEEMLDYADSHNGDEGIGASMRTGYGWVPHITSEWVNKNFVDRPAAHKNRFGFAALPAGAKAEKPLRKSDCAGPYDETALYCGIDHETWFWSATEISDHRNDSKRAVHFFLHGLQNNEAFKQSDWGDFSKRAALSVRCKKN